MRNGTGSFWVGDGDFVGAPADMGARGDCWLGVRIACWKVSIPFGCGPMISSLSSRWVVGFLVVGFQSLGFGGAVGLAQAPAPSSRERVWGAEEMRSGSIRGLSERDGSRRSDEAGAPDPGRDQRVDLRRGEAQRGNTQRAQEGMTGRRAEGRRRGAPEGRGPLAAIMATMSPEDRRATFQFIQTLDEDQRRALFQTITRMEASQQQGALLQRVRSGKAPVTTREFLARSGVRTIGELPALTVNSQTTAAAAFTIRPSASRGEGAELPAIGQPLPDWSLVSTNGNPLDPEQFRGRPLLIQVGSLTSPRYRGFISHLPEIRRVAGPDLQTLLVYTREAHPVGAPSPFATGEWIPQMNQIDQTLVGDSKTLEERFQRVAELSRRFGETGLVGIDSMDNRTFQALGSRAHAVILLDEKGIVRYRADPVHLEPLLSAIREFNGQGLADPPTAKSNASAGIAVRRP